MLAAKSKINLDNIILDQKEKELWKLLWKHKKKEELESLNLESFFNDYKNVIERFRKIFSIGKEIETMCTNKQKEELYRTLWREVDYIINNYTYTLSNWFWKDYENTKKQYLRLIKTLNKYFIEQVSFLKEKRYCYHVPLNISIEWNSIEFINQFLQDLTFLFSVEDSYLKTHQIEFVSEIISNNIESFFYNTLSNPKLSNEEKIENIVNYFRENIEDNYFFPIREKVAQILWEVFAYNTIWYEIFEKLIKRKDWKINKNIRLHFIKKYPDIDQIIEFVEENELWFRSTIAFLDRLKNEINQSYNEEYLNLYKKYLEVLRKLPQDKEKKQLLQDFDNRHNSVSFEVAKTNSKNIKNLENNWNSLISKLESKTPYRLIKEDLEKTQKIDEKILSSIFRNYPIFVIRNILSLENFKNLWKKVIEKAISDINNISKILYLANYFEKERNIKIEREKLLKILTDLAKNFYDVVNIIWNPIFDGYKLNILNNWKLNKQKATIFFKLLLKSWDKNLLFQNTELAQKIVDQVNKNDIKIQFIGTNIIKIYQWKKFILSVSI